MRCCVSAGAYDTRLSGGQDAFVVRIGDIEPPAAPANLQATGITTTTIDLVWDVATDDTGVTGYDIYIGSSLVASTTATTYTLTGLTPNTAYTISVRARDAAGNVSAASDSLITTARSLPVDPAVVAPPIDPTVVTDFAESIAFLYTGDDPIQTGVVPGTIDALSVAVLRGQVRTRDDEPLSGVTITIQDHPEYGETLSRLDGMFDIAINGGGLLTINYAKDGFLPVQRQITAPWRDFAWLPDVVMIPLDTVVTEVTLDGSSAPQFAESSVVSDTDGVRQAALFFPENVTATMELSDGSEVSLTTLHVRASEYTIGENGPEAMPGALPANSGYTYAVEWSVDEALAENAKEVRFSQPLPFYLENFIGFPVGGTVPAGYYDRDRAAWIASQNGRVIQIVGVTGGLANLDINGDGFDDDASEIGVTDAEREQLASRYSVGQELWRVLIDHFTPWDCNWPYGPPDDSIPPNGGPPSGDDDDNNPCKKEGSIIECRTQVLGEELPVAGAPFTLNYRSDRADGRTAANEIHIPISVGEMPDSLKQIDLEITVAGQRVVQSFPADPNQIVNFTWDGLDAYGREVQGQQPISVNIKYVYPTVYQGPANVVRSFARFGNGTPITGNRDLSEVSIAREWQNKIGHFDAAGQNMGAWTLSVHHTYDPDGQMLYLGDGSKRSAENLVPVMRDAAGFCTTSFIYGGDYYGDGDPATEAGLNQPTFLALGPDGSLYIAERLNHVVRRVGSDGIISTIAGTGESGFSGDNGPGTEAKLNNPYGLAVGLDGSVYIADLGNHRVRRVGPDGIITTFVGGTTTGFYNDVPATSTKLINPIGLALSPDGSLYIADEGLNRVFRVGPDGRLTVAIGTGGGGAGGDGGPALQAQLGSPRGIAIGPDGSIYVSQYRGYDGVDFKNDLIRRVGPDGIITTVAGGGDHLGDGGPATEAQLYTAYQIAVGPDGTLYIADQFHNRIRVVRQDGIIRTVAGYGAASDHDDNGVIIHRDYPATSTALSHPFGVVVRPDNTIYIADSDHHCVRQVSPAFPAYNLGEDLIPSEDGTELYHFGLFGQHLETLDATTGALHYSFTYDPQGYLIQVTDGYSRTTTIERDVDGNPVAIVAPGDMRSELSLDANGYLSGITNPLGHTTELSYSSDGLLQTLTEPGQGTHGFEYDAVGRLTRDADPVGGFKELDRVETTNGYTVTVTTALSQMDIYAILREPNGDKQRITIDSSGKQTRVLIRTDGTREVLGADGSSLSATEVPDPRLKMLASNIEDTELTTVEGQISSISTDRTTQMSDPSDPLSLEKQTDVTTINGRTYTNTTVLEDTTHTITSTMPGGLQRVTRLDAQGNILEERVPGMHPRYNTYNEHGLLIRSEQGDQIWTYQYDERDLLIESTDPLSNTTFYTSDAAGQLIRKTLPDGQTIAYAYDPAGNLTMMVAGADSTDAITTTYGYDANGQVITTTVGVGTALARTTTTAYNADGAITQTIQNYQDGTFDPARPDEDVIATYGYDALGRHIWTQDTNGRYVSVAGYNDLGQMLWMVRNPRDGSGQPYVPTALPTFDPAQPDANIVTQYAYDDLGRTTLVTETGHLTGSVTIQPDGTPLWSSAPPLVTRTEYDLYHPITVTLNYQPGQPATADTNVQTAYRYNTEGRLIWQRDALGHVTTTEYSPLGQPITVTLNLEDGDPLTGGRDTDQIVVMRYDPFGRLTERIEHYVDGTWDSSRPDEDRATHYVYDQLNRVTTTIVNAVDDDPDTGTGTDTDLVTSASYSPVGAVESFTDALGRQTVTQYNDLLLPVARILNYDDGDAATGYAPDQDVITQFAYDPLGRLIDQWNPGDAGQGRVPLRSHSAYDGLGRLVTTTTNYQPSELASPTVNLTNLWSYDAFGNLAAIQSARGITTTLSYDLLGRQVGMQVGAGGYEVAQGADGRDARRWSRDERGILTIFEVDALGRQTAATVNYQDGLRSAGETSSDLRIQSVYDAAGRLVAEIDELGIQTSYHYDQAGNLIQVVQNDTGGTWTSSVPDANVVTNFTYDRAGNLLTYRTADGGTWTRAYDGLDRLIAQTDPLTKTTSFAYDRAGNLLQTIDARGVIVSSEYDALDRPVRQFYPDLLNSSAPLTTTWAYLATGERSAMHDPYGVTSYATDALGRTTAITDTAGHTVRYEYDAAGNRTALIYPDGTRLEYSYDERNRMASVSVPVTGTLVSYTYDPAGRLERAAARITPAITLTAEYGYDDANRITSIDYFTATTQIGAISYAYDAAGNRRVITETLSTPGGLAPTQVMEASYDDLFRLVESELNSGDRWEYSYDGRGNRVSDSITHNSVVTTTTQTYDPAERVQGWTYDDAGNLLDDGTFQFDYDAFGRIVRVTMGSDVINYGYNGDGVRIAQEANGTLTTYVNDLNAALVDVLEEHTSGNVTRYRYGLDLLGTETAWHTTDALGSVRQVLTTDGTILGTQSYDPFGAPLDDLAGSAGFTGEWQNSLTGLVHLRARWYDPRRGMFLGRDPYQGYPRQPYSMHPYQYAYSNPLRYTDPSGKCLGWLWGASDCKFVDNQDPSQWNWQDYNYWISMGADIAPLVGDVKGFVEVFTGCDMITGEYLGYWRFLGLLPVFGKLAKELKNVRRVEVPVEEFREWIKLSDDIPPGKLPDGPKLPDAPDPPKLLDGPEAPKGPDPENPKGPDPENPKDPDLPNCTNSFSADTLVATTDGLRPISQLAVGDLVLAYDEDTGITGLFTITNVLAHQDPSYLLLTIDDAPIETTQEHPFYTWERGWVNAGDLQVGEHVHRANGGYGIVLSIAVEIEPQVMYNLTVAVAHTFFVGKGRWLVHNIDCNVGDLLPNADQAEISQAKFDKYSMNKDNPQNKGKWEAWEELGYDISNEASRSNAAQEVITQLRKDLPNARIIEARPLGSGHGPQYEVQTIIQGPNGKTGALVTVWQFDNGSSIPRLITNFVKVYH